MFFLLIQHLSYENSQDLWFSLGLLGRYYKKNFIKPAVSCARNFSFGKSNITASTLYNS